MLGTLAALATPVVGALGYLGTEYVLEGQQKTMHQWRNPHYYEGAFPQEAFPCKPLYEQHYQRLVAHGKARMAQESVVICGLARNISDNFEKIKARIETTGSLFKNYTVLIFENDSHDGTRTLLEGWAQVNARIKLLSIPGVKNGKLNLPHMHSYGATSLKRIEKMTYFRNIYLDEVKKNYRDYNYMLVVDMDIKGPWNDEGIAHSVAHDNWDAIASLGLLNRFGTAGKKLILYDVLAHIPHGEHIQLQVDDSMIRSMSYAYNESISALSKGDPLVRVRSAFGGMALYKIPSILKAKYEPIRCEHIGLHEQMARHGFNKIFLNPAQIILVGHQGNLNKLAQWLEKRKNRAQL